MGAWGLGLFQSDYDYDIIDELSDEAGDDVDRLYNPEDPHRVRKLLDDGILQKLIDKHTATLHQQDDKHKSRAPPKYTLVLLGALAMELGCHLTNDFRQFLRDNYRSVGLMRDALTQMSKGLAEYKNGEAYDFGSLGLHDTMAMGGPPHDDLIHPNGIMMNVPSPEMSMDYAELIRAVTAQMKATRNTS